MVLAVKECSVKEIVEANGFGDVVAEYKKMGQPELPDPETNLELYVDLEAKGALKCFASFKDERLVGFITVLLSVSAHYGKQLAFTESFFVREEDRATGAGLKLLALAERTVKGLGVAGIGITTQYGSVLAEILPRLGYRLGNIVYVKGFDDDE